MKRYFKTFLNALIASLALSAIVASAAQAIPEMKAKEYPATLSGTQVGTAFFAESGLVSCEKGTSSATMTKASSTLTVSPSYEACQSAGYPVTVETTGTGCSYVHHLKEKLAPGLYNGTFDFACPAGNYILLTAFLNEKHNFVVCQVKIFPQTGFNKVTYSNFEEGGKKKVEMTTEVEGFTYFQEGILCASGKFTSGALEATVNLSAKNKGGQAIDLEVAGA